MQIVLAYTVNPKVHDEITLEVGKAKANSEFNFWYVSNIAAAKSFIEKWRKKAGVYDPMEGGYLAFTIAQKDGTELKEIINFGLCDDENNVFYYDDWHEKTMFCPWDKFFCSLGGLIQLNVYSEPEKDEV